MEYEQFLALAKEATPTPMLPRMLRASFENNGPLAQLVHIIVHDVRQGMVENLINTHMISEETIRKALGTQGQISGVDNILHFINEAMKEPQHEDEPAEDLSVDERPEGA